MSTRWYPLFQPGNPQLRVFLPNFWMKLIRDRAADDPTPKRFPHHVQFIVSMEMTKFDITNYLKRIYNVNPIVVNVQVRTGETREVPSMSGKMVVKDDDYKVAYVTLAEGDTFEFPDIYPKEKLEAKADEEKKQIEQMNELQRTLETKDKSKPGIPGWFE